MINRLTKCGIISREIMKNIFIIAVLSLLTCCSSYTDGVDYINEINTSSIDSDELYVSSTSGGNNPIYDGGGVKIPLDPNCRDKIADPTIPNHLLDYSSFKLWRNLTDCVCAHSGCEDFCLNQEVPDQECRDTAQWFCLDQWVNCYNDPN